MCRTHSRSLFVCVCVSLSESLSLLSLSLSLICSPRKSLFTSPTLLKSLSGDTELAGIIKYCMVMRVKRGNSCWCCFHHILCPWRPVALACRQLLLHLCKIVMTSPAIIPLLSGRSSGRSSKSQPADFCISRLRFAFSRLRFASLTSRSASGVSNCTFVLVKEVN
jgi:hypothetical protein